jgi:CubicO group peptidase (beta-lactamase class C family)
MSHTHHPWRSIERDSFIDEVLEREIVQAAVAPTAVAGWGSRSRDGWLLRVGCAGKQGFSDDAVFDLASVTKPLTASVAARLVADGRARWSATVGEVLTELADTPAALATLEELLAHRGGAPAWGALWRRGPSIGAPSLLPPDDLAVNVGTMLRRAAVSFDRTLAGPQAAAVYSDIGYVVAGAMIARLRQAPLAEGWAAMGGMTCAARRRACDPDFDRKVVPTEDVPWRGGLVSGAVHDENAYFLERAGGDPGHAGAFGTVRELASFGARFIDALPGTSNLSDVLLPAATANAMLAPRDGGTPRIGWDTITPGASSSGRWFGLRTFGHLGFTGTSLWCDPDTGVVAVLLTNRVYPTRANDRIRSARPRVHDALWEHYARDAAR